MTLEVGRWALEVSVAKNRRDGRAATNHVSLETLASSLGMLTPSVFKPHIGDRGKFRSFILGAMNHFLADERAKLQNIQLLCFLCLLAAPQFCRPTCGPISKVEAELVKLHYFGGMTNDEATEVLASQRAPPSITGPTRARGFIVRWDVCKVDESR